MLRKIIVFGAAAFLLVAGVLVGTHEANASPIGIYASSSGVHSGDTITLTVSFNSDEFGFTVYSPNAGVSIQPINYGCAFGYNCYPQSNLLVNQYPFNQQYPFVGQNQFPYYNQPLYGEFGWGNFFGISDADMQARDIGTTIEPFTMVFGVKISCNTESILSFFAQQNGSVLGTSVLCNPVQAAPVIPPAIVVQPTPAPVIQQVPQVQRPVPSVIQPPRTGDGGLR